jgi:uncharacterized membrane protein YuzA (DUF378 family)
MKGLHGISFILVAIGGLNWGLIGLGRFLGGDWNVVHMIFGFSASLEAVVYVLVGVATVLLVSTHKKDCRMCSTSGMGMGAGTGTAMPS